MKRITLFFIRKIKALFMLFHLHVLVEPFTGALLNLVYLSKMSAWRAKQGKLALNDFYSAHYRYDNRQRLHRHLMESQELSGPITYLEFGVARGESFRWWVEFNQHAESTFHGFDTFTGLPEDWNVFKKGDMSAGGQVPDISDSRITWHAGLFQETLPPYLANIPKTGRRVVHLDGDLYSSAYYAMNMLAPYLQPGDVLIFDEFGVPTHEFKAFTEFFASHYRGYEVLGAVNNYLHLAVRLT
jgi:hypothetical protein